MAGHPGYRLRWDDGIVEIRWTCGKANAMNGRSLAALKRALDDAEAADARGVVLTGYDRFFSAGLDLVTLYDLEPRAMDAFMIDFDRLMLRAFAFSRPLITAVGGHAVAGGCVLALAGDVRVMTADGARMGLNEIRLGVPFPAPALEIVRHAVSPTFVEAVLLRGGAVRSAGRAPAGHGARSDGGGRAPGGSRGVHPPRRHAGRGVRGYQGRAAGTGHRARTGACRRSPGGLRDGLVRP